MHEFCLLSYNPSTYHFLERERSLHSWKAELRVPSSAAVQPCFSPSLSTLATWTAKYEGCMLESGPLVDWSLGWSPTREGDGAPRSSSRLSVPFPLRHPLFSYLPGLLLPSSSCGARFSARGGISETWRFSQLFLSTPTWFLLATFLQLPFFCPRGPGSRFDPSQ